MENRIVTNYLKDYLNSFEINEKSETVAFEHFCNYCILSHINPDAYSSDKFFYEEVHTGQGGDMAIDGMMIVVNDIAIKSLDQLNSVIGRSRPFSVKFIFIQAKTSASFDVGEVLKIGAGVKSFFVKKTLNANEKVLQYKKITDAIFDNSLRFVSNPECHIYYVTMGKWVNDINVRDAIENVETQLSGLNYFSINKFHPIDADRIATIYRELNNTISREIIIAKNVAFPPEIPGIQQAYLGLVKMDEYMKLVTDEDGVLQAGLFYENVRGFLGDNPVNKEIQDTLERKESIQFPILNNGITIVTKSLRPSGEKFALTDFQIVNGCQTTNVLFQCRKKVSNELMIPIKIISTNDGELINRIIRSTNRQTLVLDEAFESLKEFHKKLQQYYDTYTGPNRIYYERRTHEYDPKEGIRKSNIITLPIQLYSIMSMFYGEPHSVHRYYGELLRANANKVFQKDHQLSPYYVSAWALHQIEVAIRNGVINSEWRQYRYHILYLLQLFARPSQKTNKPLRLNSKDIHNLALRILDIVNNKDLFGKILSKLTILLSDVINNAPSSWTSSGNKLTQIKDFTTDAERKLLEILSFNSHV